jgi:hypothetical protein
MADAAAPPQRLRWARLARTAGHKSGASRAVAQYFGERGHPAFCRQRLGVIWRVRRRFLVSTFVRAEYFSLLTELFSGGPRACCEGSVVASPQTEVTGEQFIGDDDQRDEPDRPDNILGHCCLPEIGMPPAVYALSRDPAIIVDGVLTLLVNGCWPLGEALINSQRNHQSSRLSTHVQPRPSCPRARAREVAT